VGQWGEMTQALYAHMNNKTIKIFKKQVFLTMVNSVVIQQDQSNENKKRLLIQSLVKKFRSGLKHRPEKALE
jgi:hypothetical protein